MRVECVDVYSHMNRYKYVWMWVHMYVHSRSHVEARDWLWEDPAQSHSPLFTETESLTEPGAVLASQAALGLQIGHHVCLDFTWVLSSELWSTHSYSKHFILSAISPVQSFYYIFYYFFQVCVCVCMHLHMCVGGSPGGQRRMSDPQKLELQAVLRAGNWTWVLCGSSK